MDSLWIEGGRKLSGTLEIPAAKNAALPLLCLTLMTAKKVSFRNLPQVVDIKNLIHLLQVLGVQTSNEKDFMCPTIASTLAPYDLVRKMRASILVLGPLLARAGHAEVSLPGGCAIGERPVDIHLKGLEALGAKISIENGYIHARADRLRGSRHVLRLPSVTGSINLLMAACLAKGETELENIALEPEVLEICQALKKMGAKIEGEGTSRVLVQGVDELNGLDWQIQPDRIQLLTYLAAAAITGGKVECRPYHPHTLGAVLQKFREMGCEVNENAEGLTLSAPDRLNPVEIETAPFPGFPTDAQAQFVACLSVADRNKGSSFVRETIFENRFQHVSELRRMGAQIDVKGNLAVIQGVDELSGASVMASDLRASASLVLAGLKAKNQTQILRVYHLDRGYEDLEKKLSSLGAKIWRQPQ